MKKSNKAINFIFLMYHGLFGALLGVFIIFIGQLAFFGNAVIVQICNSIGSAFIVGSVFGLFYNNLSKKIYYEELKFLTDRENSGYQGIYPKSKNQDLVEEMSAQILTSKEVKMYGIAINVLWDEDVVENLKKVLRNKQAKVSILLADVQSEQIQRRLLEEKKQHSTAPTRNGKDVISNVLEFLRSIEKNLNRPDRFKVATFSHYPTFAFIIIDEDVYYYPYGFQTDGTHSPLFHFRGKRTSVYKFFSRQFELLESEYLKYDEVQK